MTTSSVFDALWPDWWPERVLYCDADLVVVDKPAGLSTHSPDVLPRDDVTDRVRRFLAGRDGRDVARVYLGVHASLERDTSGVLAMAHDRRANASLAAQFARSRGRRTYVAAVAWRRGASLTLSGATVRVLESCGTRALVSIATVERTASALREQLARAGHPVVGDPDVHPGQPAARLMLHLAALTLQHPTRGRESTFEAPVPDELVAAARGEGPADVLTDDARLAHALRAACARRHALGRDRDTTAFRLVNAEGDGIDGVTVDRLGDYAMVQFYSPAAMAARDRVLDAVASLGARGVYAKYRPKQANTLADTRRDDLAPRGALRGTDAPDEFVVREAGLAYRVRPGDGLSTGLFLDQRENRRAVRSMAEGARVLNLFAYTAPFTVAALAGGARASTSVDVSAAALSRAADNLRENGFAPGDAHALVAADVFGWLAGARARGDRYDLVLLDPPSYATTHDSRFSADTDYRALATEVLALVAPGGRLLACTNHRGMLRARFRRYLYEAAATAGRVVRTMRDRPDPVDFPPAPGSESHLKSVLLTLD